MTLRILVTGSRSWSDRAAIRRALEATLEQCAGDCFEDVSEVTVVHGAARGADRIAGEVAAELGYTVEDHPVTSTDWFAPCQPACKPSHRRSGRNGRAICPAAGNYRNLRMIRLGADICLAFPLGPSSGTRQCMAAAKAAGIHVEDCSAQAVVP